MWIDQLCINQEDTPERNDQVSIMGKIYRGAAQVIIWLDQSLPVAEELQYKFDKNQAEYSKPFNVAIYKYEISPPINALLLLIFCSVFLRTLYSKTSTGNDFGSFRSSYWPGN
jgi:hypothetical protein